MAETKKTTETKTVKSSETKAAAPKATAAKKTTTKAAAPKATATKTTAKAAAPKATAAKTTAKATTKKAEAKVEVKAETAAVEVAPVKTTESKKAAKPAVDMIKVTLVKSGSGRLENQKRTLEALGLRKTNSSNILPDNAAIRGMIFVVKHLVSVEKVK